MQPEPRPSDEPFSAYRVFGSREPDEIRAAFSRHITNHDMRVPDRIAAGVSTLNHADFGDFSVSFARLGGEMVVMAPDPIPSHVVMLPRRGQSAAWVDGQESRAGPGGGHVLSATRRFRMAFAPRVENFIVRVERGFLESVLAAELGDCITVPLVFDLDVRRGAGIDGSWGNLVSFLGAELRANAPAVLQGRNIRHVGSLIATALLYGQPNNYSARLARTTPAARPGFVRRCEEYIRANPGADLGLSELARIGGVSVRTLVRGFRSHRDCAPGDYIRAVRLDGVRGDLLRDAATEGPVTAIALKWGFGNYGRFAQYYRERYGETPFDTARRARRGARGGK